MVEALGASNQDKKESSNLDPIFYQSWVKQLNKAAIFSSDDYHEWKITSKNCSLIMRTLNVYVPHFN